MSASQDESRDNFASKLARKLWRRDVTDPNPPDLTRVYAPPEGPVCMDIVFVHGLGGTSRGTWTGGSYFWPGSLDKNDPLQMARVWTFGYRADFKKVFKKSAAGIHDFGLELLCQLRNNDEICGSEPSLPFQKIQSRRIPLVFVAHSMGGLVIKEAYLECITGDEYKAIAESICAMLFLGTPHQGSALATTLAWCFETSGRGVEPFVSELQHNSHALEECNKNFCDVAARLEITSFYETLETRIGPISRLIVDKNSSRVGSQGELRIPMETDHRNIARYYRDTDSNLNKIVHQLQRSMDTFGPWKNDVWKVGLNRKAWLVSRLLGVSEAPQSDFTFFLDMVAPGTCKWLESDHTFLTWRDKQGWSPEILWMYGLPGCGKSVLASYAIRHLQNEKNLTCHYFFCRQDDDNKTSIASLLRSIALQTANSSSHYLNHLAALAMRGTNLEHLSADEVWNQLFANELPNLEDDYTEPVYWVIDGLDICPSGDSLFTMLASNHLSRLPLRILILSQWSPELCTAASRAGATSSVDLDTLPARDECLRSYAESRLGSTHPSMSQLTTRAQGNFLWIDLVLNALPHCYTDVSIAAALEESQSQFETAWRTICSRLTARWRRDELLVAKSVLAWATYAKSPLSVSQLKTALRLQGLDIYEQHDAIRLCGSLLKVNRDSRISLSHGTVRQFLTEVKDHNLYLEPQMAHTELLRACMRAMVDIGQGKPGAVNLKPFHCYAMASWKHHMCQLAKHITSANPLLEHGAEDLLSLVEDFLDGRSLIEWMYWAANTSQLNLMVSAANALNTLHSSLSMHSNAADTLARPWADELLRILGQFGGYLLKYPRAIYTIIPPFCPGSSLLRNRVNYTYGPYFFDLKGFFRPQWGDLLARISKQHNFTGIACANEHIALSTSSVAGDILVYTSLGLSHRRTLRHGEFVQKLRFSNSGTMLATYGMQTVKVWQIDIDHPVWIFNTRKAVSILDIVFNEKDTVVFSCAEDGNVWAFPLRQATSVGTLIGSVLERAVDGSREEVPNAAAFQPGTNLLATSYKYLPVSVWVLTGTSVLRRRRQPSLRAEVKSISWVPSSHRVLIVRYNGSASLWSSSDQRETELAKSGVDFLKSSVSGALLIFGDCEGSVSIRRSTDLSLVHEMRGVQGLENVEVCLQGQRVYGLRGNTCDIWGPTCLARYLFHQEASCLEMTEATRGSQRESTPTDSQASVSPEAPVEVIAVGSRSNIYCTAHSQGKLRIFGADGNILLTASAPHPFSIIHLAWSNNEKYLAIMNDEGSLSVKRFGFPATLLEEVVRMKIYGSVHQVLFTEDSKSLILSVDSSITRLDWRRGVEASNFAVGAAYRWMIHPGEPGILLGFGHLDLCVLHMDSPEPPAYFSFHWASSQETAQNSQNMQACVGTETPMLYVAGDGSRVLVQTRRVERSCEFGLFFVAIEEIDAARQGLEQTVQISSLPHALLERVSKPLGLTHPSNPKSGTRMAFIDRDGLICTIDADGVVEEHVFLPFAWHDGDCLELAQLTLDGSVLIPNDGEVGILVDVFRTVLPGRHAQS